MITNIEQTLIEKIENWSPTKVNDFHNGYTRRHRYDGQYLWEYLTDGVIIWRDIGAHYISNTGEVIKISTWFRENDWFMHNQMYQQKSFRVEIPIESKFVSIKGQQYLYTRVQRPNYELGRDFQLDLFDNLVNADYFIEFIDDVLIPITVMKELTSMHNVGMPEVRFPVSRRIRDSKGHFWADLKQWNIEFDEFMKLQFTDLDFILGMLETNFKFNPNDSKLITQYANVKWKTI